MKLSLREKGLVIIALTAQVRELDAKINRLGLHQSQVTLHNYQALNSLLGKLFVQWRFVNKRGHFNSRGRQAIDATKSINLT